MSTVQTIITMAEAMEAELIAQRRDFHKYAESGWFEMRTSSIIARKLKDLKNRCRANRANGLIPQAQAQKEA